jgi:tetratricopeptide (TPR) repeat protein
MPVLESAGPRNGGGARSTLTPRVYDYLAPEGVHQGQVLSSYDPASGAYATLIPVEAKEKPSGEDSSGERTARRAAELLATYKSRLAREEAEAPRPDPAADVERLLARGAGGMEIAEAYYRARMFEKTEEECRRILKDEPDHARAATFLAMATAGLSGRQSSPLKSVEFVNRAFVLFDEALPLCKTPEERMSLYLQRGRYFAAVPESIFRRSAAAAEDYLKAAAIAGQRADSPERSRLLADCYINAAKAFAQARNPDEAEVYFHRAAEFEDLTTGQVVSLLERGIIPAAAEDGSARDRSR